MAMGDALQLAQQLTNSGNASLVDAVAAYDAESAPRSTAAVQMGRRIVAGCHKHGWRYKMTVALMWGMGRLMDVLMWWMRKGASGQR